MKSIVITGNGPSLAKIDYQRLPKDFDIFRCNNFYFEDHYWVGKKVTGYFIPHLEQLRPQFFNSTELKNRQEYDISKVYCLLFFAQDDKVNFPSVEFIPFLYSNIAEINEYLAFYNYYYDICPTTGTRMVLEAVNQGYKDIYLVGFDLYLSNQRYPFEIAQNIKDFHPDKEMFNISLRSSESRAKIEHHRSEYDAAIIKMVANLDGINVYSISEESPINEFISLAPRRSQAAYTPMIKPEGAINDWIKNPLIIRQEQEKQEQKKLGGFRKSQKGLIQSVKRAFVDKGMEPEWNSLRENIYLRLAYHIIKPIWILIKFIFKR